MSLISVTPDNIDKEHLCCALTGKTNAQGVINKKAWMRARFAEGLRFVKLNVRGKVFVEYLPAEYAWRPIEAPGYIFIHCLWVSGRYQGEGYGKQLLETCLRDAEGSNGVVVVASKQTFLTDPKFFASHGFECCDTAPPYFELMVHRFKADAPTPRFCPAAKSLRTGNTNGLEFFYSDQCPFTDHYVEEMANVARARGLEVQIKKLNSCEEVQKIPSAFGVFNVFYKGDFLTHKIMSVSQFDKLLAKTEGNGV